LSTINNSVVVATPDIVGRRMAGPGARAWHIADELARHFSTRLIAVVGDGLEARHSTASADSRTFAVSGTKRTLEVIRWGSPLATEALRTAEVVIGQPSRALLSIPTGRVAFDLFDPVVLELAELYRGSPTVRERLHLGAEWMRLRRALARGDALICGFNAQRDFYAGVHAAASGRTARWSERWLEVPFGVEQAIAEGEAIPQQGPPVIVWSGGIWEWLEPELAIEAVRRVNASGVACRLLFLGVARPGSAGSLAGRVERLERAIEEAGPLVTVNRDWVDYRERGRWLRGCKIAIMLHRSTMESAMSIRTRFFDSVACGLPMVASRGGFAATMIENEGLGLVAEPSDVDSVAGAIRVLLTDDALHAKAVRALEHLRPHMSWPTAVAPLVRRIEEWRQQRQS
jgi:glycosyltransferase involved in cell wall biosynthesis